MSREQRAPELVRPAAALAELSRQALGHVTPVQMMRGERVIEGRAWAKRGASTWVAWVAAGFAVLGSAIAIGLWQKDTKGAPLGYVVESGIVQGEQLRETGETAPIVRFSDGTEVRISTGSEVRIRSVTGHGAVLALDRGELRAEVVHAAGSEWQFDAGPFIVSVTGTSFGLSWKPEQDRFDLRLQRGSVLVSAPVANLPIPVRAGQWLTIRPHSNEVLIRDLMSDGEESGDMTAAAKPISGPPALAKKETPAPVAVDDPQATSASKGPSARTWVKDLARGRLEAIVADALKRGLDRSLEDSSIEDLAALADAARYTRRNEIARRALLAERRRFLGSREATDAAFLLGRLAETGGEGSMALRFFAAYLAEAPDGTYAPEALGRKMAIVQQTRGSASARSLAHDYLTKYPNGTYAAAAKSIVENR